MLSAEQQLEIISRGTAEIIPREQLLEKLRSGRPLRVKYGIDPTGPDVHLGHTVPIRKLRQFQELGHQAVLIIGDFTALIGDPSGRSESRPQLTREQVERNLSTYLEQISKVVDVSRCEVRHNSEWLGTLTSEQIIRLCATQTVAQTLSREDFANRLATQQPISLHELLYPIYQGYDSVAVQADVELGATEQKFNFLVARELQQMNPLGPTQEPQVVLTLPILVGTDGVQRMGKSLGNYIGINEPPDQMFGKLMSIPDESPGEARGSLIGQYFELCTDVAQEEIGALVREIQAGSANPRDAKLRLAQTVVAQYHGEQAAARALERWQQLFSSDRHDESDTSELAPVVALPATDRGQRLWVATLLVRLGLASSASEARRLVRGGGVYVNQRRIEDPQEETELEDGLFVRVGKRRMAKLTFR